jgi:hypothetical protein
MAAPPVVVEKDPLTVDVPREFHQRMAAIIEEIGKAVGRLLSR